jgi:regulation of enolase protein 1 (concanavalin A-like superfamily)
VVAYWGALVGASRDCQLLVDGPNLTITIPGSTHLIIPEAGLRNAPIMLTREEVQGDFAAQVQVVGHIRPGVDLLPGFPFTFQGAGLLLWQDENNYLRFERTASHVGGKRLHQVLVELCREGHTMPSTLKNVSDTDIVLRFERHGSEVKCDYSLDGAKSWLPIKRQPIPFNKPLKVGVSASNVSPRPFSPRFEGWELTGPGGRAALTRPAGEMK